MQPPHRRHNIFGWLIDLAALAAALVFAITLMLKDWMDDVSGPVDFLILCYAIPAANIIWLQIRLASRMPDLAFRPRREELALTFIPARNYLAPHFKWPMVRVLAPTCLAWPLLIISIAAEGSAVGIMILVVMMCLGSIITGLALSAGGVFDLLIRQCRAKSTGGVSCILIPAAWSAGAIAAMPGPLWLCTVLMGFFEKTEYLYVFFIVILALFCLALTIILWRKAIALFNTRNGDVSCLLIPVIWSFFTIVAPVSVILIPVLLPRVSVAEYFWSEGGLYFLLFTIVSFILAAFALIIAIKRWRKAVEVYYYFD